MLGPADLAVVDRDRDLPALPLLLDAAALSEWLTWQTGEDCRVHPGRLRYKPGTSCVLAFVLERGPDGEQTACLARTYHTDQAHKVQKSLEKTHPDAVLAVEHALPLMVTDVTGDRDVVALARLRGDRADLLNDLLPDRGDLATATLTTLSHNPERRWVGLLGGATGAPVVLRAHRRSHFDQHVRGYAPHGGAEPRTPRLLGASRRHALVAVEWVAGRELDLATADRTAVVATGAALAHFHDGHVSRLAHLTPDLQADAVRRGAEQCALLQPALTMEVTALADAITARLAEMRHPRALLHGDFSADQVVVDADGSVTIIDLDSAGRGHPAADLGSARAAALVGDGDAVPGAFEAVLAGYESVRPLPSAGNLAAHTAAGLVRRAGEPFRRRDPDWANRMTRILELAQRELAGTSVRQGA